MGKLFLISLVSATAETSFPSFWHAFVAHSPESAFRSGRSSLILVFFGFSGDDVFSSSSSQCPANEA
eukprot:m.98061 g.98061  ORF g.98061 m.98061 type:complete len:67 (+) comp51380_c0_seq19:565-765(+)